MASSKPTSTAPLSREWLYSECWEDLCGAAHRRASAAATSARSVSETCGLRVMSYNLLAPSYATSGFDYTPPRYLAWAYRWSLQRAEIARTLPHILALQEVEQGAYDRDVRVVLRELGYKSHLLITDRRSPRVGVALAVRETPSVRVHTFVHMPCSELARHAAVGAPLQGRIQHLKPIAEVQEPQAAALPASSVRADDARANATDGRDAAEGTTTSRDVAEKEEEEEQHGVGGPEGAHAELWSHLGSLRHACVCAIVRTLRTSALQAGLTLETAALSDQRTLLVGSFHCYWNPRFPELKAVQTALVVREMSRTLTHMQREDAAAGVTVGGYSMMLAGDFNAMPAIFGPEHMYEQVAAGHVLVPGVYELMRKGTLDVAHPNHPLSRRLDDAGEAILTPDLAPTIRIPVRFASAYVDAAGAEPDWTNWHTHSFKETLDYIWLAQQVNSECDGKGVLHDDDSTSLLVKLEAVSCLDTPSSTRIRAVPGGAEGGCPNQLVPSDHIFIAADVYVH